MKKHFTSLLLSALFLATISGLYAQELPKSGAVIRSEAQNIQIKSGDTFETELKIIRSRVEKRTQFDIPVVQEIQGLHASITATDVIDVYTLKLTATTLEAGDYLLIIKGAGENRRYLTSLALPVTIASEGAVATANQ
jgi:hypothetical protein